MDIYVIRHAQALDRLEPVVDAHRPLTARGRKDARRLGKLLRHEEVELDALVVSPLVRAVETASQLAEGLEWGGPLEVAAELELGRDPMDLVRDVLLPRADLDAVALVGHQPQLGALLGMLLRLSVRDLAKPSVVRVRWLGPEEPARFKWALRADLDHPSKDLADVA